MVRTVRFEIATKSNVRSKHSLVKVARLSCTSSFLCARFVSSVTKVLGGVVGFCSDLKLERYQAKYSNSDVNSNYEY